MTIAILIGDALLLSAVYLLQRRGIDTVEFQAGRVRFVQGQAFAAEEVISHRRKDEGPTRRRNTK